MQNTSTQIVTPEPRGSLLRVLTIFMLVLLHQGPPADGVDYSTPHPVVTVELDEQAGLRLTSTVVGVANDEIGIGRRVEVDWAERAGEPLPVFRMLPEEAS